MSIETHNGEKKMMATVLKWGARASGAVLFTWAVWLSGNIISLGNSAKVQAAEIVIIKQDVRDLSKKFDNIEHIFLKQVGGTCSVDSDIPTFEDFGGLVLKSKSSKEREGGAN